MFCDWNFEPAFKKTAILRFGKHRMPDQHCGHAQEDCTPRPYCGDSGACACDRSRTCRLYLPCMRHDMQTNTGYRHRTQIEFRQHQTYTYTYQISNICLHQYLHVVLSYSCVMQDHCPRCSLGPGAWRMCTSHGAFHITNHE